MANLPIIKPDRKVWLVRGGIAIASVAGLAIALPVVYGAFLASLGLLGIGIVGVVGAGLVYALPLLGQKCENLILGLRKAEARANPIEQLQNQLLQRKEEIAVAEKALGRIAGIIKSQERKLEDRAKSHPNHDLSRARKSVASMGEFYKANITKLTQTIKKCQEYEEKIDNAIFERDLSTEGQLALKGIGGSEGDYVQKLLADEAFKSVSQEFDELFGQLEVKGLLERAEQYEGIGGDYSVTVEKTQPASLFNERTMG